MGVHIDIKHDTFPKQGDHYGRRVHVCFHYDTGHTVMGTIVRDDKDGPTTLIWLEDGRILSAGECQYMILFDVPKVSEIIDPDGEHKWGEVDDTQWTGKGLGRYSYRNIREIWKTAGFRWMVQNIGPRLMPADAEKAWTSIQDKVDGIARSAKSFLFDDATNRQGG